MRRVDVIRAWKKAACRADLITEEFSALQENASHQAVSSHGELEKASGARGAVPPPGTTFPGCTRSTLRVFRSCPQFNWEAP